MTNLARILMNTLGRSGLLRFRLGHKLFNVLYAFRIRNGEWR